MMQKAGVKKGDRKSGAAASSSARSQTGTSAAYRHALLVASRLKPKDPQAASEHSQVAATEGSQATLGTGSNVKLASASSGKIKGKATEAKKVAKRQLLHPVSNFYERMEAYLKIYAEAGNRIPKNGRKLFARYVRSEEDMMEIEEAAYLTHATVDGLFDGSGVYSDSDAEEQ
jgi:hypothetical protein